MRSKRMWGRDYLLRQRNKTEHQPFNKLFYLKNFQYQFYWYFACILKYCQNRCKVLVYKNESKFTRHISSSSDVT